MNRTCGVRKKKDLVGGGLLSLETRTCRPDKQEISSSRLILCKKKNVSTPPHVFCAGGDSHPFFPDFACQLTSGVQKCFAHSRQSQTVIALQGYVCRKMRNVAPRSACKHPTNRLFPLSARTGTGSYHIMYVRPFSYLSVKTVA